MKGTVIVITGASSGIGRAAQQGLDYVCRGCSADCRVNANRCRRWTAAFHETSAGMDALKNLLGTLKG